MDKSDLGFCVVLIVAVSMTGVWGYTQMQLGSANFKLKEAGDLNVSTCAQLKRQVSSYQDYFAFQRIPTYVNENGNSGMFDPDRNLLYVNTSLGAYQSCLIALHEIGHSLQSENNDPCFFDSNKAACEIGATKYSNENAWRCWGI